MLNDIASLIQSHRLPMGMNNASDASLKGLVEEARSQGWFIQSMKCEQNVPERRLAEQGDWIVEFYRPATDSEIEEQRNGIVLSHTPRFRTGCRWCGNPDAVARQVPNPIPCSDVYCGDCAGKCEAFYASLC